MVYKSYNKENKLQGIIVSCSCGCSNIEIKTIDDSVFISLYGSNWYSHQGLGTIRDNVKIVYKKLKRNKIYLCGLMMSLEETIEFVKAAKEISFGKDTEDRYINDSHLELEYLHFFDDKPEDDMCELQICLDSNLKDIVLNKGFRGTEICLKKDEWYKLINKLNQYLCSNILKYF